MLEQKNVVQIESEDHKMKLICDSDTPLGVLHDFLLKCKGEIVDRMIAAQKQEQEFAEKQMKQNEE